ncbi:MAG: carbon-nitrogen hydrolase family protein [Janthinobacterium lividum]
MSVLRLALLQQPIGRPADIDAWAALLDARVAEAAGAGAELLVMPEYGCVELAGAGTGDGPPDVGRELDLVCAAADGLLDAMRAAARRHGVWLLPGTLPWRDAGPGGRVRTRNRAPLIAPDGRCAFQDKSVMTRFESEVWDVEPGAPPAVFDTPWGRIGICICYDVEFPALARAQVEAGAWLILAPSCTDTIAGFNRVRLSARARALENQCFVAITPTVGLAPWLGTLDANRGYAAVFGPVDRGFPEDGVIARGALDAPGWVYATLDRTRLDAVRADGGVRNHRDWPGAVPACGVAEMT